MSPVGQAQQLLDRRAAARHLGVGTTTLDKVIGEGRLPVVRIGRRVLVHIDDLHAFVEQSRQHLGGDAA